jgi:hypothetical protein
VQRYARRSSRQSAGRESGPCCGKLSRTSLALQRITSTGLNVCVRSLLAGLCAEQRRPWESGVARVVAPSHDVRTEKIARRPMGVGSCCDLVSAATNRRRPSRPLDRQASGSEHKNAPRNRLASGFGSHRWTQGWLAFVRREEITRSDCTRTRQDHTHRV